MESVFTVFDPVAGLAGSLIFFLPPYHKVLQPFTVKGFYHGLDKLIQKVVFYNIKFAANTRIRARRFFYGPADNPSDQGNRM